MKTDDVSAQVCTGTVQGLRAALDPESVPSQSGQSHRQPDTGVALLSGLSVQDESVTGTGIL
jgi:hypothetical protein